MKKQALITRLDTVGSVFRVKDRYICKRTSDGDLGFILSVDTSLLTVGDIYELSVKASAESYRTLTVELCEIDGEPIAHYSYKLCRQLTELVFPFKSSGREARIKILTDHTLGDSTLCDFNIAKSSSPTIQGARSGYRMVKDSSWAVIDRDYTESRVSGTDRCTDVFVCSDGYIYALASGTLQVFLENGTAAPDLVWKNTADFMGEVRQMELDEDRELLAAVSRSGGVYLFSIKNRKSPEKLCHFDSLEMATGVDISGDYLYIADRIYGVSIYNIEDPTAPKIISTIDSGECQDVAYYNGFIYCGIWGAMKARIYDVRDIDAPKHAFDIPLSGRGDGVTVSENLLYVATGHHEPKNTATEDIGYGVGNGMEIWDVTDPYAPACRSVVRCDGRTYDNSPDIWRVRLAENYAFLSSSYSGLYVFDISDPHSPLRVAHINIKAEKGETGYKDLNTRPTFVFPYDTTEKMNAPIIGCDIYNGILYLAGHSSAMHAFPLDIVKGTHRKKDIALLPRKSRYTYFKANDPLALGFTSPKLLSTGAQLWTVKTDGKYLYAAAGADGIYVMDTDLNLFGKVKTAGPCHDLALDGDTVYTAESTSGLGIYYLDPTDRTAIKKYSVTNIGAALMQTVLAPGGRFILGHINNSAALIDVSNHDDVRIFEKYPYPMFYQRQISTKAAKNRYLWCYSTGGKGVIEDFGPDGSFATPVSRLWLGGSIPCHSSGITADGDRFFVSCQGAIYLVDPSDENICTRPFKESGTYKIAYPTPLDTGAPEIIGDYLFLCDRLRGFIRIYKWESADHSIPPTHIKTAKIKGYPTLPVMIDKRVYIPLGYAGILAFDL